MYPRSMVALIMSLIFVVVAAAPGRSAHAQAAEQCFPETQQCLSGRFRDYWQQSGGLAVFGFPITAAENAPSRETGQTYLTQWLERNRFELHPENQAPYDVLLGRLGDDRLQQQGRDWQTFPKADPGAAHFFAPTGHAITHEPFWQYWSSHGLELGDRGVSERESLALFGLPISEPALETNASGDTVLTQWFERARFEDHGAQGVLLGLLGNEVRTTPQPTPSPSPSPSPSPAQPACTGVPESPVAQAVPACIYGGDKVVIIGRQLDAHEGVGMWLTKPDGTIVEFPVLRGLSRTNEEGTYTVEGALSAQSTPGIYGVTIQGRKSGRAVTALVKVFPTDPGAPARVDYAQLPEAVNATVNPISGPIGTRFGFKTTGFKNGTIVRIYAITPDGSTIESDFEIIASNGDAAKGVTFATGLVEEEQVGVHGVIFESKDGAQRAEVYFRVQP